MYSVCFFAVGKAWSKKISVTNIMMLPRHRAYHESVVDIYICTSVYIYIFIYFS